MSRENEKRLKKPTNFLSSQNELPWLNLDGKQNYMLDFITFLPYSPVGCLNLNLLLASRDCDSLA